MYGGTSQAPLFLRHTRGRLGRAAHRRTVPFCIVVAAVATGQSDGEGRILRFVFFHSLALAGMIGLLTVFQAWLMR